MRILALVGATATGKTAVAETLAPSLGAEIVCADSRQVFRGLDVGTGKPSREALAAGSHHLFGVLGLGERASAGWYACAAAEACAAIAARGRLPLFVGGSGLYLRAVREGLAAIPPHDPAVRARLRAEHAAAGDAATHARLGRSDPESAARLAPRDAQRVLRALEVFETSGKPLSWWHRAKGAGLAGDWRIAELTLPAARLSPTIEMRTRWMFEHGLLDEARAAREAGLEPALRALRAVGYDEALDLLDGHLSRDEAEARTSLRTRQLAKRQRTWFRHQIEAERVPAESDTFGQLVERVRRAFAQTPRARGV